MLADGIRIEVVTLVEHLLKLEGHLVVLERNTCLPPNGIGNIDFLDKSSLGDGHLAIRLVTMICWRFNARRRIIATGVEK